MSDQQGWQQPNPNPFPPPQAPPGYPPPGYPPQGAPWPGPPVPPQRPSRRLWWIWGAVGLVLVIAIAGVAFTVFGRGGAKGADSPAAAVRDFLTAAERNDLLAAADLLDPSERISVRRVLENAGTAAQGSGFQQGKNGNGLLDGVTFAADDVQTEVTQVRDDLARVTMTGGEVSLSFDPAKANEGIRDLFTDRDAASRTWRPADLTERSDRSGTKVAPAVLTVQRSGRWYVSLLYTFFDRQAQLDEYSAESRPVQTKKYASPEEAAKGFVDGVFGMIREGDVSELAETLSPDEGQLVSTYRKWFNHSALDRPVDDLRITSEPRFDIQTSGNTATIRVTDLAFEYSSGRSTHEIEFPDCNRGDASWCYRSRPRPLPSPTEINRHGYTATRDAAGWHVNVLGSYLDVAAGYLEHASKEETALLIARIFDLPAAFTRLDADATIDPGSSATVDLKELPNSVGQSMAVVDVPVQSGRAYSITTTADDYVHWVIVGKSGELGHGYSYSSRGGSPRSFTAPDDETLKLVLLGDSSGSVSVTVDD